MVQVKPRETVARLFDHDDRNAIIGETTIQFHAFAATSSGSR